MPVATETAGGVAQARLEASFAARGLGDFPTAIRLTEEAHAAFVTAGDVARAVSAAALLVTDHSTVGATPAARGWEQRGLRLLKGHEDCVERGYLALAHFACDVKDPQELRSRAELALQLAQRFHDHQLELHAEADRGLALIGLGEVDTGFELLDSVMAAVAAGELQEVATLGMTLCTALTACERTGDVARAEYWVTLIEDTPALHRIAATLTHCELVRGGIAALCGRWPEAERHLSNAMTAPSIANHAAASRARLAELRIQQGRYDDAKHLLDGMEGWVEAAAATARLHLVGGDLDRAAALLRSVVRDLGLDCMRLGPALALLAEVELRRGDAAAADRAARKLRALDERCSSNEIRSLVHLTAGRVALHSKRLAAAIDEFETALTLLVHIDRPLLQAQIRLELSRALLQSGDRAGAEIEASSALATFTRLGVVPEQDAARAVLSTAGDASSRPAVRAAAIGGEQLTPRELEVAHLVATGLTNRDIAKRLTCLSGRWRAMSTVRWASWHSTRGAGWRAGLPRL